MQAYRHGCFPWDQDGQPILWGSPDPRTVVFPGELPVSRPLRKGLRQGRPPVSFGPGFASA
ncbi:leucyl/phenylalanyl-tRNA--protein transferase, partial [Pseudomonas putida]